MSAFADELRGLLNRHGIDAATGVPDFVLAEHVAGYLGLLGITLDARERWLTDQPKPVDPSAARAVPGIHDSRSPAAVRDAFPGTRFTREFLPGVQTSPGSLVAKVRRLLDPSWTAGLVPVWSMKLDFRQVMAGEWDRHIIELAEMLAAALASELVIWHEPENDRVMQGGAFPVYFNRVAEVFRTACDDVPLIFASMAYQHLPNGPGTGSIKGLTDNSEHWRGARADRFATDVYSGSSVLLDTILPEHKGVARWLANIVPAGARWSVTERGWGRPASTTMSTAEHQQRALSMRREADWLASTDEGARVEQVILWNTPGTEGNPNLVFDTAYGVPAARDYIARLAATR